MNPIIINMWKLIDEFQISLKIINDLFDGIETDLKEKQYLIIKRTYQFTSYRVAGTVGLMMAKILNVKNKRCFKISNKPWYCYAINKHQQGCSRR